MDWFAQRLLSWFDQHGRKDLPWQTDPNPYRVWVSEIMLQQTQVTTVIPFYQRFMTRFPTVRELADAPLDEVLHHWTGLGYYARARNMHSAARIISNDLNGTFPAGVEALSELPGIGRSTAGAIAAISQGQHAAILDGNVKRVLARYHAEPGYPGETRTLKALWQHAEQHTPAERVADYTQAIMDLGATVCARKPGCSACPVQKQCTAYAQGTALQFPERRPKKPKPTRRSRMYLITDPRNDCLLEQRPTHGIWGGLWSPPERDAEHSLDQLCTEFGLSDEDIATSHAAAPFRHSFTHFHLDIEPVYVQLTRTPLLARDDAGVMWYSAQTTTPVGLSAPAVTLLNSLSEFELT